MRVIGLIVLVLLLCGATLPDPALTPGAINSNITQANIGRNICNRGHWSTKLIRPPASFTNKLKLKQMAQYGYRKNVSPKDIEEDHLISLEIGGCPRCAKNLWPQPRYGVWNAQRKDNLENRLHRLVCAHSLTLKRAQHEIATNWITAYKKYIK